MKGVLNARELGGLVLPDGAAIKEGLLLRCASLSKATDEDLELLHSTYDVRMVFDFRSLMEVEGAPDRVPEGAEYLWLPAMDPKSEMLSMSNVPSEALREISTNLGRFLAEHSGDERMRGFARRMYTDMVINEYSQLQYAAFLHHIANLEDGAVLWHCTQGKDRTGLGAAFLLAALGADRDLIMKDFALSADYYAPQVNKLKEVVRARGGDPAAEKLIDAFVGVSCENFEAALDLIDKDFGSMDNYLSGPLGLTDADRKALRSRLTR